MRSAYVTMTAAAAALLLTACQDQGRQQGTTGTEQQATGQQEQERQQQYGEQQQQEQAQAGQQEQQAQQELLHRSTPQQIQGEVSELNEKEGTLTLRTQQGDQLEIHGTPEQLQTYQQGQQANLDYVSFEGTNWIANPSRGTGQGEQVQGRVSDIKAAEGEITLEGAQPSDFRAHPENLQQIQPGQQVSITYESKQDVNWASQIQAEGSQQPGMESGQQEQMGGQQEQMGGQQEQMGGQEETQGGY